MHLLLVCSARGLPLWPGSGKQISLHSVSLHDWIWCLRNRTYFPWHAGFFWPCLAASSECCSVGDCGCLWLPGSSVANHHMCHRMGYLEINQRNLVICTLSQLQCQSKRVCIGRAMICISGRCRAKWSNAQPDFPKSLPKNLYRTHIRLKLRRYQVSK